MWIHGRDAAGSFGVGALVAWDRRILSVLLTASTSTCDYLRGLGWAAWFGGVGLRAWGGDDSSIAWMDCADTIGLDDDITIVK